MPWKRSYAEAMLDGGIDPEAVQKRTKSLLMCIVASKLSVVFPVIKIGGSHIKPFKYRLKGGTRAEEGMPEP